MVPKTIGIIGDGAFSRLIQALAKEWIPGVVVKTYKRRHSQFEIDEVAQCDFLFLAVPIHAYRQVLKDVLPLTPQTTVIIDVATVKEHTIELLTELAPERPWIATHPMFGPGSYEKQNGSVVGFTVVVCSHTLRSEMYKRIENFLTSVGLKVVQMKAYQHDKLLAETLFITHLVAQSLKRAKFLLRTEIDTPSVHLLKDAAEIVQNDTELFKDVVQFNRHCREAMVRWHQAQSWVWDLIVDAM